MKSLFVIASLLFAVNPLFSFNGNDTIPPTPVCLTLAADIAPNGERYISPAFIDGGSTDNCTPTDELVFKIQKSDADGNHIGDKEDFIIYTCDDLGIQYIIFWVFDGPVDSIGTNSDYCITTAYIQDNSQYCGITQDPHITFNVYKRDGQALNDLSIFYDGIEQNCFFPYLCPRPTIGTEICLKKNQDYATGISTFDILLIRKHLLNIQPFISPYEHFAADVNQNGAISTIDILLTRKILLGIDSILPNEKSWRFIDPDFTFTTNTPLQEPYEECLEIVDNSLIVMERIAIKIGDVNDSASPNISSHVERNTSDETLKLKLSNRSTLDGIHNVEITLDESIEVHGLQMAMEYDKDKFHFIGLSPESSIALEAANIHVSPDGLIKISWDNSYPINLRKDDVLFNLIFEESIRNSGAPELSLNNKYLAAELYDGDLNIIPLTIEKKPREFSLQQNYPNPFSSQTSISFSIPSEGEVELKVFDLLGNVIYTNSVFYPAGTNKFLFDADILSSTKVFFYQLSYMNQTLTKQMVKIN